MISVFKEHGLPRWFARDKLLDFQLIYQKDRSLDYQYVEIVSIRTRSAQPGALWYKLRQSPWRAMTRMHSGYPSADA